MHLCVCMYMCVWCGCAPRACAPPASWSKGSRSGREISVGEFQMTAERLWAQPGILGFALPGPAGRGSGQRRDEESNLWRGFWGQSEAGPCVGSVSVEKSLGEAGCGTEQGVCRKPPLYTPQHHVSSGTQSRLSQLSNVSPRICYLLTVESNILHILSPGEGLTSSLSSLSERPSEREGL